MPRAAVAIVVVVAVVVVVINFSSNMKGVVKLESVLLINILVN